MDGTSASTSVPKVTWMQISAAESESKLSQHRLASSAPVIAHSGQLHYLFTDAWQILRSLLGDVEVQMTHDQKCTEFPEVGKNLKQLGLQNESYAVATCPSL